MSSEVRLMMDIEHGQHMGDRFSAPGKLCVGDEVVLADLNERQKLAVRRLRGEYERIISTLKDRIEDLEDAARLPQTKYTSLSW